MASRPTKTPTRIPPPRDPRSARPISPDKSSQASQVPLPSGNLAKDAAEIQAHVDQIELQFDSLRAQLRQAQKLASIGTTAAMIAHEFNNLFTPVVAYARQALDTDDTELMKIALNKTLDRTATMREMADRVIGLAKQSEQGVRAIKLRGVVENAVGCLCRDLGKDNITLNIQIDPELTIRANENQLIQVIFNLVINARQAMLGRKGRLTIDAAPAPDGQVALSVRDTGCGIAPENLERIFEPFFSTKTHADRADRGGLGLGLAICRDIIEEFGGRIDVTSRIDVGTTFTLTLPAAS